MLDMLDRIGADREERPSRHCALFGRNGSSKSTGSQVAGLDVGSQVVGLDTKFESLSNPQGLARDAVVAEGGLG